MSSTFIALATASVVTMTSKEVAELTGKRHDHVLRDVDNLLLTLSPDLGKGFKSSTYEDATGKSNRIYVMDRDSTLCLISGYDPNARMRIVKRWQELEAGSAAPNFNDPVAAAEAWLVAEKARRAQAALIVAEKPYVELGHAVSAEAAMVRRDWVALMKDEHGLGAKEREVDMLLLELGYLYREPVGNTLRAYAHHADLFKLVPEVIHGYVRQVLKISGEGMRVLTPVVLRAFNE